MTFPNLTLFGRRHTRTNRLAAIGLGIILLISTFVAAPPSARTARAADDTVPLPKGFMTDPRYREFFADMGPLVSADQLARALVVRDPGDEGQLPLWQEVQALMMRQAEHDEYAWALRMNANQKNFQIGLVSIKKIISMYTGVGDDWGSASWMTEKAAEAYLKLVGWSPVVEWRHRVLLAADAVSLYRSLQQMKEFPRNQFIWWAAQDDVAAYPPYWDTLSLYVPSDMDTDQAKTFAQHIYQVVNGDPRADWGKVQDKILRVVGLQRTGIHSVKLFAADGTTPLPHGAALHGDTLVVKVGLVNPTEFGSIRLDVRPVKEWYTTDPVVTHFSNTPPAGGTAVIPVSGLAPGEYRVRLRLVTNQGLPMGWQQPDDAEYLFPDFVIRPAGEAAPAAPTLLSATPASDGASPGVILKWTPVKGATQYQIYRDGAPLVTTRTVGTTFWNIGLVSGRSYTYAVRARQGNVAGPLSGTLTATAPAAGTASGVPRIVVDGVPVPLDVAPANVDGRLLVPLRAISEALGATVGWDGASQTATLTLGGTVVKVTLGSLQASVNGKPVTLAAPAMMADGRVLVPLRFVGESFGADVSWDAQTQTVRVFGAASLVMEPPLITPGTPAAGGLALQPGRIASSSSSHVLVASDDGRVWAFGSNSSDQLGDGNRPTAVGWVEGLTGVTRVAAGGSSSAAVTDDGALWVWGDVTVDSGDGRTAPTSVVPGGDCPVSVHTVCASTPQRVPGLTHVVDVALGYGVFVALQADGSVWTFGGSGHLLGLGCEKLSDGGCTFKSRIAPTQVPGLTGVVQVSVQGDGMPVSPLAVKADGTVWIWGSSSGIVPCAVDLNCDGPNSVDQPVQVTGLPPVRQALARSDYALAVTTDGQVWAWGNYPPSNFGTTGQSKRTRPFQIPGLEDVVLLSADTQILALKKDGTVWAWGQNVSGQLGPAGPTAGSPPASSVPVQVPGLPTVVDVVAGWGFSLALDANGRLWAWGSGSGFGVQTCYYMACGSGSPSTPSEISPPTAGG